MSDKAEEKKEEASTCCSSTSDKMAKYKESFLKNPKEWLEKPAEMFPEVLMSPPTAPLIVVDKSFHKAGTWMKPTKMSELLHLLEEFKGECKIVVGNTEIGIETNFKHAVFPRLICPSHSISSIFSVTVEG